MLSTATPGAPSTAGGSGASGSGPTIGPNGLPLTAEEEAFAKKQREKEERIAQRTKLRLEASLTGIGLEDWMFNASLLVKDCVDDLEADSPSLEKLLESVHQAAQILSDDNWDRFSKFIADRVHRQDHEVHGALFAKVESSWRPLLTTPRSGSTAVFLHVGTDPPTAALCELLTKLGWFGVSISPKPMVEGYDDLIEHHALDPAHDRDRDSFVGMCRPDGGCIPKPSQFLLTFVNVTASPDDEEPDSDEELGAFGANESGPASAFANAWEQSIDEACEFGYKRESGSSSSSASPKAGKQMAVQCSTASGYGCLGITRYASVRKRLRGLYCSLLVALNRLKQDGAMVLMWPGLPCHPVMFFLTSYLRNLFMRVHVVAMEGTKTFETYILCANFNREKANDPTPGEGGTALKSFLSSAYRRPALDDVLLWTLPANAEHEEAFFGVGGKSKSRTYDELWTLFANKYKTLASELDLDVTKVKTANREKKEKKKKEDATPKKHDEEDSSSKASPKKGAAKKGKASPKAGASQRSRASTPESSPERSRSTGRNNKGSKERPRTSSKEGQSQGGGAAKQEDAAAAAAAARTGSPPSRAGSPSPKAKSKAKAKAKASPEKTLGKEGTTGSPGPAAKAAGHKAAARPGPPQAAATAAPASKTAGASSASPAPSSSPSPPSQPVTGKSGKEKTGAKGEPKPGDGSDDDSSDDDDEEEEEAKKGKKDKKDKEGDDDDDTKERKSSISSALDQAAAEEQPAPPKKRKPGILLSRSVPSLSCTLGAAPGSLGATHWQPNRKEFASQFKLINFGLLCAEHKVPVRKFHRRRPSVNVSLAGDAVSMIAASKDPSPVHQQAEDEPSIYQSDDISNP